MLKYLNAISVAALLVGLSGCGGGNDPTSTCGFHAGALPEETLPQDAPHGSAIPVDHIVVLMQENRSFDSYFGQLPAAGHRDVDGLPANAVNPDPFGVPQPVFHQPKYCTEDTNHTWTGSHLEFHDGLNDGFEKQNEPKGARAMGYYDESDLPFSYALAKTFAIGDHYFCSLLGPTFPNRFYLLTGTSFGHIRNDIALGLTQPTVFDLLNAHGISWKEYYTDFPYGALFRTTTHSNLVAAQRFFTDAAAGTLPQVAFFDSAVGLNNRVETDEHPPANIQQGQQLVAQVIQAVMQGPNWPTTALFYTFDEHGGFYDHVVPPSACAPDDIAPMLDPTDPDSAYPGQFDRYGFRVPVVVVSPFAKPGFVSHAVYDHTSILRFIETRFDLPALTNRDANASPLLEMFDFSNPALLNPPSLPVPIVDPARLDQCRKDFPGRAF